MDDAFTKKKATPKTSTSFGVIKVSLWSSLCPYTYVTLQHYECPLVMEPPRCNGAHMSIAAPLDAVVTLKLRYDSRPEKATFGAHQ